MGIKQVEEGKRYYFHKKCLYKLYSPLICQNLNILVNYRFGLGVFWEN